MQAYACQIFADEAAAQAVEDGAHLRPLASPQASASRRGGVLSLRAFLSWISICSCGSMC